VTKDLNLDENIIRKNKIPILVKDKEWLNLFQENMTKNIRRIYEELEELIEEEKEITKEIKDLNIKKKRNMEQVLHLSDMVNRDNHPKALERLDKTKAEILEINGKLEELLERIESIPEEINQKNFHLLQETVFETYMSIKNDKERISYLDEEIQKMREILRNMWEEKFSKEKKVNTLYSYLHSILGHEEIDRLDKRFL